MVAGNADQITKIARVLFALSKDWQSAGTICAASVLMQLSR